MGQDLSAFLVTPPSLPPIATEPVSASPLRPAVIEVARHTPVNAVSVADMYLNVAQPSAKVVTAENQQTSEIGEDGKWRSVVPPTPKSRPRRRSAEFHMPSLGVVDSLMDNEHVHDIVICGTQPIYADMQGQMQDTGLRFNTHEEVWAIAESIMDAIGQRWDDERPMIDTRLPDGSRVNMIAPPMSVDGVSISIRKFSKNHITLEQMVEKETITQEIATFLQHAVRMRLNIIIAGGTGSGKTTLLNALSAAISPQERIVTVEDCAELRLQQPQVVRLEAKQPHAQDEPETGVTIRDLVRNAMRMRPDRIIIGESRGPEAFDVLQAMNTGHDGSMATLHSNTPRDAVTRLEGMITIAMPQMPIRMIRQQIASTVNLIVQMNRTKQGVRRISHISEISGMEGETMVMQDLLQYQEGTNGRPEGYRWIAQASRNPIVTEAARHAGIWGSIR